MPLDDASRSMTSRPFARAALFCVLVAAGCQTPLDLSSLKLGNDAKSREMANTANVVGPLERMMNAIRRDRDPASALPTPEALAAFDAAKAKFDAGDHAEARKEFKKIAKEYKHTTVGEDAQFYMAESDFNLKRYARATDGYSQLIVDYPSTRHLDRVSERNFAIAQEWLQFPKIVKPSDVEQVNFDDIGATPPPPSEQPGGWDLSRRIPVYPNWWDRSRPVFDTKGRALEALKSIWLNDPTGPLADDALMLTASHYLRDGDYLSADDTFQTLRQEYPDSPHMKDAMVLNSHTLLMSYQGAAYDATGLEESAKLKESVLHLFPDAPERDRMRDELRKIAEKKAEGEWETALLWEKKGNKAGAIIHCEAILEEHPHTSYAALALEKLANLRGTPLPKKPVEEDVEETVEEPAEPGELPEDNDGDAAPRELPEEEAAPPQRESFGDQEAAPPRFGDDDAEPAPRRAFGDDPLEEPASPGDNESSEFFGET